VGNITVTKQPTGTKYQETLAHFNCYKCQKWWAISDGPKEKKVWYCPWCGTQQQIIEIKQK